VRRNIKEYNLICTTHVL